MGAVFWAAVAFGGCAQENPLFGLGGTGPDTKGVEDSTGLVGLEDTGVDDTRGTAGDDATDAVDPTSPDDDDDSIDNDDADDDADGDGDGDAGSDTGPGCPPAGDCLVDDNSCTADEKCTLYHSDVSGGPDAIGCTPLHPNAVGQGRPCQVNGCGFDDCDQGLVCPRDDEAAICIPICTVVDTSCPGQRSCVDVVGPPVGLCAHGCDLLEQNCLDPEGGCYDLGMGPVCASVVDNGGLYDPCEFANACAPGFTCVPPGDVAGCTNGGIGCCTAFCSIADEACPDGLQCTFADIAGAPSVGVCVD